MKQIGILTFVILSLLLYRCKCDKNTQNMKTSNGISEAIIKTTKDSLLVKYGDAQKDRIEKGLQQVSMFWQNTDGNENEFIDFCITHFIGNENELKTSAQSISNNFESLWGYFHRMDVDLQMKLHLDMGEINKLDMLFGQYNAAAHLSDDFFENKIAFSILLNFPYYSLEDKNNLGKSWTREQWAMARIADIYTSRVPALLKQKASTTTTNADTYISEYNIFMHQLVNDNMQSLFPEGLKLITHWGLRDELKSNYNSENGLEKQKLIYQVMLSIINQEIPQSIINSDNYQWNPISNVLYENGKKTEFTKEPNTRYQHLLNNFHAQREQDAYNPYYNTYIKRAFEQNMEMSQQDVEKLFIEFVSSPQVKEVAALIKSRLGRDLQAFDIWYDGFKARSSINESDLDKITQAKYPNVPAFQAELPIILGKLGWDKETATRITSKIVVDPSRGAGHAWGAEMKSDVSHLRTRIAKEGMNYKGYNIAIHEFGHNVEQTITLHNMDYYMLHGVPNTAFTEAIAFLFQRRDLEILGMKDDNPAKEHLKALDNFWNSYEIMGVSLVDMKVWQWLYENPDADAQQLKEAVIRIAKEVWNSYYAEIFGVKDSPILAIYSHMIDAPLYLSAYPIGHLIDFQIEQYIADKDFAKEVTRMLEQGRIVPKVWMKGAVGDELSIQPTLKATQEALAYFAKQ